MALTKVNYPDSDNLILGTGNDLYLYHDGSNSYVSDLGTGDLKLTTNGAKISLQKGTSETMADFTSDGSVDLYYDNTKVFETISWGVQIAGGKTTGDFIFDNGTNAGKDITWDESDDALEFADSTKAVFGTGGDLQIYHDGTNSSIKNTTGDLYIDDAGGNIYIQAKAGEQSIVAFADGAVDLYHNNVKKLETSAAGVTTRGRADVAVGASTSAEIRLTANDTGSGAGDRGRFNVYSARNDGTAFHSGYIDIDRSSGTADESHMIFATNSGSGPAERARITKDGALGVGVSPSFKLHVKGGNVDKTAEFANTKTADNAINYISVALNAEGTTGSALFGHTGHSTTGSQCAWFGNGGDDVAGGYGVKVFRGGNVVMMQRLLIGVSGGANNVSGSDASSQISYSKTHRFGLHIRPSDNNTGGGQPVLFQAYDGSSIGSISADASNVAYNTSSDYRLKENDVKISNGITRLKQLRPIRFNWKVDSEKTVDGFFAHEVSSVVPEAVTGTKDQTHSNGDVNPQQLDHSKLVPLLTAALQEAITEIETLKTKVAALEAA